MIPYHPRPKFSVRPHNFRLVQDHPLWSNCESALLGAVAGSDNAFDSTLNNRTGALDGSWTSFLGRTSMYFNGTTQRCEIPVVALPADFTIAALVRLDTGLNSRRDVVFQHSDTAVSNNFLQFELNEGSPASLRFQIRSNSPYQDTGQINADAPFDNEVHDVVLRRTGSTVEMVIDGVVQTNTGTFTTAITYGDFMAWGGTLRAGSRRHWIGPFGDAMIWNRALSTDELGSLMTPNVMLGGAIEPIPTQTYLMPAAAPTLVTDVFQSAIIGD